MVQSAANHSRVEHTSQKNDQAKAAAPQEGKQHHSYDRTLQSASRYEKMHAEKCGYVRGK
eukprot:960788-Pleurochrysis_carterae.AAC.2